MSLLTWKFFCGETGGGRDGTCFCQIIPSCLRRRRRRRRQIVMSGSHVIPRLFSSVFFAGKIHTIRGGGKCRAVNAAAAAAAVRILTQDAANFGAVAERPLTR